MTISETEINDNNELNNNNAFKDIYILFTKAFDYLNRKLFNNSLDNFVLFFEKKGRSNRLAFFQSNFCFINDKYVPRIVFSLEYISEGSYKESLLAMVHEMVHFKNFKDDKKDCSGKIHNLVFKQTAESVGYIITEKCPKNGWSFGEPNKILDSILKEFMESNSFPINFYLPIKTPEKKEQKSFNYVCVSCGISVKGKKDLSILCGECKTEMVILDPKDKENDENKIIDELRKIVGV